MAILKGIEASIIIDGKALTEYDDEDAPDESSNHTGEVSKYIEAVSNAEFSISITVPKTYKFEAKALCFDLSFDGAPGQGYLCLKSMLESLPKDWHRTIPGARVKDGEEWYLRPFKFDDIKIVEASTSTAGSGKTNSVANLGTITLDMFDEKVTRKVYSTGDSIIKLGQSSDIAEKELKGRNVTHQATFGESRPSQKSTYYYSNHLSTKPILSFKFKYRSKKALQGLHLIPSTPSPSPVPISVPLEERPFDSLTPDEVQELSRRLLAKHRAEREANIKPEKIKSENSAKRKHDQEYEDIIESSTVKRAKTRPFRQGETIELD